jgi:hypothetical protein
MERYVTLMGAKQVQSAGSAMRSAADEMSRAASSISNSLEMHQRWMDDWLMRLQDVMEKNK